MSEALAAPPASSLPPYDPTEPIDALAARLDAATHDERVAWMRTLTGRQMSDLFRRCDGRAVTLDDVLLGGDGPMRCEGKNGLSAFNAFAKVFARVDGKGVGYNANSALATWFAGPGHYVAYDAAPGTDGKPGEVVIDYRVLPEKTHDSFPPLRSNNRPIGPVIVYGHMYDLLRSVSRDVFIGDSYRKLPGGQPFTLVRPR